MKGMEPQDSASCPLCGESDQSLYHTDKYRPYYQCGNCRLIFVPPEYHLNSEDEKAEYDLHNNDSNDSGYREFLSRLSSPLTARMASGQKGLDFGCGPGPTLSVMMEDAGHEVDLYDPFYFPDASTLEKKYDFITSTEVIEHLQNPGKVFSSLFRMLNPGGYLGLMTKMVIDNNAFRNWHYIQDPTHICFYSRETFEYIADRFSAEVEFIGNDVIIFTSSGIEYSSLVKF
ncbi:MAG: class I SAM-dependent methyltransferase [Spirochaetaceae bacterium]|nr:class I SAM-dependent methyltransferase [Spirochaetaceae bacterium]